MILRLLFVCFFLATAGNVKAQQPYQYYYLTVGSANYEHHKANFRDADFVPYDNLPEAALSANLVQGLFEKYVHAKGKLLVSTDNNMITGKRLFHALSELDAQIKKDKPQKPFIVFYYCGHGISENMGWNQFMIPGNYTAFPGNKSFDDLMRGLIFLGDITDFFLKRHYEYLVMVDCCRRQEKDSQLPEKKLSYFFDAQNLETFKTVVSGLKYLNEYHQPDPVVFAIEPGSVANTVAIPSQNLVKPTVYEADKIGPICRRILLAFQNFYTTGAKQFTVQDFVKSLTNEKLDTQSHASISFYEDEPVHADKLILITANH